VRAHCDFAIGIIKKNEFFIHYTNHVLNNNFFNKIKKLRDFFEQFRKIAAKEGFIDSLRFLSNLRSIQGAREMVPIVQLSKCIHKLIVYLCRKAVK
jgi:hypothetical protein